MSIVSNHYPEVLDELNAREEAEVLAGAPVPPEPTEEELAAIGNAAGQLLTHGGDEILNILPEDGPAPCRQVAACTDARQARKPRSKPVRTVRLVAAPLAGLPGIVSITVGRESFTYWISSIVADFGRAFRLEKFGDGGESYAVNLGGDGHYPAANVRAFCAGGEHDGRTCKHLDGIRELVNRGTL